MMLSAYFCKLGCIHDRGKEIVERNKEENKQQGNLAMRRGQ